MASFAAILAIGNPVALDARAEERETRGFISITTIRPVDGERKMGAAGLHPDLANDCNGRVSHCLILAVGERLCRGYCDRIASMYAHGIEVLDRANDDHVVVQIAHDFEFVFFPPEYGFF